MRKKLFAIVISLMTVFAFTACGSSSDSETAKIDDTAKQEVKEDVSAPYLGYAKMTDEMADAQDVYSAALNSPSQLLTYDAGKEYTAAIVRFEQAKDNGKWEVKEEKRLPLIGNLNKGYMVMVGDETKGFEFCTPYIVMNEDEEVRNAVKLDSVKDVDTDGFTESYFGDNEVTINMNDEEFMQFENRIDMSKKQPIVLLSTDTELYEKDGKPASYDKSDDENIVLLCNFFFVLFLYLLSFIRAVPLLTNDAAKVALFSDTVTNNCQQLRTTMNNYEQLLSFVKFDVIFLADIPYHTRG